MSAGEEVWEVERRTKPVRAEYAFKLVDVEHHGLEPL
jgi:hypothetical protein